MTGEWLNVETALRVSFSEKAMLYFTLNRVSWGVSIIEQDALAMYLFIYYY